MSSSPLCCGVRNFDSWPLTLMRLRMRRDSGDSSGEGTSRRWLVGEWGGRPVGSCTARSCWRERVPTK